jgi:DNA repair protein RecO (recombination protein O)
VSDGGLRQAGEHDRVSMSGDQWLQLQRALDSDEAVFTDTLHACAPVVGELKAQLRAVLHYHCGVRTLRTRQMMIDLQSL